MERGDNPAVCLHSRVPCHRRLCMLQGGYLPAVKMHLVLGWKVAPVLTSLSGGTRGNAGKERGSFPYWIWARTLQLNIWLMGVELTASYPLTPSWGTEFSPSSEEEVFQCNTTTASSPRAPHWISPNLKLSALSNYPKSIGFSSELLTFFTQCCYSALGMPLLLPHLTKEADISELFGAFSTVMVCLKRALVWWVQ